MTKSAWKQPIALAALVLVAGLGAGCVTHVYEPGYRAGYVGYAAPWAYGGARYPVPYVYGAPRPYPAPRDRDWLEDHEARERHEWKQSGDWDRDERHAQHQEHRALEHRQKDEREDLRRDQKRERQDERWE